MMSTHTASRVAASTAAATDAAGALPKRLALPAAQHPFASMPVTPPTLFGLFSSPSFCFLLFQGIIVGRIRDVAAPRRHRRLSFLTHLCLRAPVIFFLLVNANYIIRILSDPLYKSKLQQDVLYNCFRLLCLAVDIDVFLECMERGNHQFEQPLNLVEWCLTFHFTPKGKDILVITLIQIIEIVLLQFMGMAGLDRTHKLIPTTLTGLAGLGHFLLRWNSPDYPSLVALAKWPELFCLFISSVVCILYGVSYMATGGKLRQRPGSLSKATFPKLTEPYSLAVFKMGGACLDVAQTAPFRNEDEPIIVTPESNLTLTSGYSLKYSTPQSVVLSRTQRVLRSIPFFRLHLIRQYLLSRLSWRRRSIQLQSASTVNNNRESDSTAPESIYDRSSSADFTSDVDIDVSDDEYLPSEKDSDDDEHASIVDEDECDHINENDSASETESVLDLINPDSDDDTDVLSSDTASMHDDSEIYKELYYLIRDLQEPVMSLDRAVSVPPLLSLSQDQHERARSTSMSNRPFTRSVAPISSLLYRSAVGFEPFSMLHDAVGDKDTSSSQDSNLFDYNNTAGSGSSTATSNLGSTQPAQWLRNRLLSITSSTADGDSAPSTTGGIAASVRFSAAAAPDEDDMHIAQGFRPCVVCHTNSRSIVLKPCCCLVICDDCREELALRRYHNCPTCRRKVESYSKIYEP